MTDKNEGDSAEYDGVEVWGTPADSLPIRPIRPEELESLLQKASVAQIRLPRKGNKFSDDDDPGPEITGDTDTISEFLVITIGGSVTCFRYGWPEVIEGELRIPRSVDRGVQEGFVKWRKNTLQFDSVEVNKGSEITIRDSVWEYFEERSIPLEGEENG